jgi:hypothetical protein
MIEKRKGYRFYKKIEKPDENIVLKAFDNGVFEIGDTYIKFHDPEEEEEIMEANVND